jgi:hypothetical protein
MSDAIENEIHRELMQIFGQFLPQKDSLLIKPAVHRSKFKELHNTNATA